MNARKTSPNVQTRKAWHQAQDSLILPHLLNTMVAASSYSFQWDPNVISASCKFLCMQSCARPCRLWRTSNNSSPRPALAELGAAAASRGCHSLVLGGALASSHAPRASCPPLARTCASLGGWWRRAASARRHPLMVEWQRRRAWTCKAELSPPVAVLLVHSAWALMASHLRLRILLPSFAPSTWLRCTMSFFSPALLPFPRRCTQPSS